MHPILLLAFSLAAAGPAYASSIEMIKSETSVPDAKPRQPAPGYRVPVLPQGQVSSVEIRQENGETKIYRTENFLGGSPVIFVTKGTPEALAATKPAQPNLDREATAGIEDRTRLDLSAFALRQ